MGRTPEEVGAGLAVACHARWKADRSRGDSPHCQVNTPCPTCIAAAIREAVAESEAAALERLRVEFKKHGVTLSGEDKTLEECAAGVADGWNKTVETAQRSHERAVAAEAKVDRMPLGWRYPTHSEHVLGRCEDHRSSASPHEACFPCQAARAVFAEAKLAQSEATATAAEEVAERQRERAKEAESEIDHWRVKAKCYGDMVHGCSPALAAAGFPVDASGPGGGVEGVKRSVDALKASALAAESRIDHAEREVIRAVAEAGELRDKLTAADSRALAAEAGAATLANALRRALAELGGQHSAHWDRTMQHGAGCEVCIREQAVKAELRAALAINVGAPLLAAFEAMEDHLRDPVPMDCFTNGDTSPVAGCTCAACEYAREGAKALSLARAARGGK